jgi:hypothetical protein
MAPITLWNDLERYTQQITRRLHLPPAHLAPLLHPRARMFGDCEIEPPDPRRIRLRITQLDGRRPLSRRTILGTLAHELAHLRHPNHNTAWRTLRDEIRAMMDEPTLAI